MMIFICVEINKPIKYQSVTYGFDKLLETQSINFCYSLEYQSQVSISIESPCLNI